MLKEVGIVKSKITKSCDIFIDSVSSNFLAVPQMKSSDYVKFCWDKYKAFCKNTPQDNSMNGMIFELIIQTEMYRRALCPMFIQAQVAFVPNVNFDVLLFSAEQFPIGLSLKTSLRKRYKQADLEAVSLKYVHRRALNYLITFDEQEARTAKAKAVKGEMLGLDNIIVAVNKEFDELIEFLLKKTFIKPEKIEIITSKHVVSKN